MSAPRRVLPPSSLGLRDFLHRARVLQQYRDFLRELHGLDAAPARELREQIRAGFSSHRGEPSRAAQKQLLTEGTRQLQILRTYVGTARRTQRAAGADDPGSWVGTGDAWDVRGRVGERWPWGAGGAGTTGTSMPRKR